MNVGRLGGYYALRHYRACDHLVGNTCGIVGWLRAQGWDEAHTHYLPNFSRDLAGARPAADVEPGSPVLLALGRLHTDKGFDTLIRAMAQVDGARLLIAGVGPEQRTLERLAERLGVAARVRFLGWRHDVAELLAACDVFVCSSRVEPLGNMVIEAWSGGRPVVAAAAAGPRELIRPGEDGLLVPIDDPAALAAAINATLREPVLTMGRARHGRGRFETEFSAAIVVERWRAFLAGLRRPVTSPSMPTTRSVSGTPAPSRPR